MNLATPHIQLVRLEEPGESREILEADVRNGLSSTPKRLASAKKPRAPAR